LYLKTSNWGVERYFEKQIRLRTVNLKLNFLYLDVILDHVHFFLVLLLFLWPCTVTVFLSKRLFFVVISKEGVLQATYISYVVFKIRARCGTAKVSCASTMILYFTIFLKVFACTTNNFSVAVAKHLQPSDVQNLLF